MSATLPPTIHQGIVNFPGATPESKATAERLLEEDREAHHCFWGKVGFHNHLSHHILAAYDFGATAQQLEAIYKSEKEGLIPIHTVDRKTATVEELQEQIKENNWTDFLGQEKFYAAYFKFFTGVVAKLGPGEALEKYIFAAAANGNGADMLLRFVGGALHPLIQVGYAIEFGSAAMLAQALAQTAVHSAFAPETFDLRPQPVAANGRPTHTEGHRQPSHGHSLLALLREAYESPIMHPVMPYDPSALLSKRRDDALNDGRAEEILRLSGLWYVDISRGQQELDEKFEELQWVATLLLAGTSKPGRKPRLDFFLMHLLNASLFIPSLFKVIPSMESKAVLLRALIPVLLLYLLTRGRPRINPELLMTYTEKPQPPNLSLPDPDPSALGDLQKEDYVNPWPQIISSVLLAPDAHTVKAIRTLYYAAQQYGTTRAGGAIGAFLPDGTESHVGMATVDGTIFVRAAGAVMNTLGWVSHGQKEGQWDRSALGWEDAWKDDD